MATRKTEPNLTSTCDDCPIGLFAADYQIEYRLEDVADRMWEENFQARVQATDRGYMAMEANIADMETHLATLDPLDLMADPFPMPIFNNWKTSRFWLHIAALSAVSLSITGLSVLAILFCR